LNFGDWTWLNVDLASRDYYRGSTYLYFFDRAWLAANVQIYPAGPVHKVALFDYEFITAICGFNPSRAMMDQVAAQGAGRATRSWILSDVVSRRKETTMRA
jgi:hypothetical protein